MKSTYLLVFAVISLMTSVRAASLKQAQFTRVINDVRMLPSQQQPVSAKVGDTVSGLTAVSTGVASRAELQFPDKTLTRIGANSVFKLDKADRTIDLEKGVMLLQVPKQIGGAKVRTAAVTAAVTGTTVMVEYSPDGAIKIIVLEGEVDVYLNDKPSVMRTLVAGDMLILPPDATSIPMSVKVDLDLLRKTSKLMDVAEFGPLGNQKHLADALTEQGKLKNNGELLTTAFEIMGRGTQVTLSNEARQEIFKNVVLANRDFRTGVPGSNGIPGAVGNVYATALGINGQNSNGNPGTGGNGNSGTSFGNINFSTGGVVVITGGPFIYRPILYPGTTVFGSGSTIKTDPQVSAYNSITGGVTTMQGTIYQPGRDGPVNTYLFGGVQTSALIDQFLSERGNWFAFKGENLFISGNIGVNTDLGPRNLLIASQGDLTLTASPRIAGVATDAFWTVPASVDSVVFAANGSIVQDSSFAISGAGAVQSLAYYAVGVNSDVLLTGTPAVAGPDLTPPPSPTSSGDSTLLVSAGRDVVLTNIASSSTYIAVEAGRDVSFNNSILTAQKRVDVKAVGSINITNSSILRALTDLPNNMDVALAAINGSVNLNSAYIEGTSTTITTQKGDINIIGSGIFSDVIKAQVLSTGGQLLISGGSFIGNPDAPASLVRLYGDGASGVRFSGDNRIYSLSTDIAGKSVTIDSGSMVRLSHPANTRVFTDQANYNNGTHGNFTDLNGTQTSVTTNGYNHASKPAF